jgi:hypothetical protein
MKEAKQDGNFDEIPSQNQTICDCVGKGFGIWDPVWIPYDDFFTRKNVNISNFY